MLKFLLRQVFYLKQNIKLIDIGEAFRANNAPHQPVIIMFISLIQVKQENLGQSTEKADYYSTHATITFFSKDKALYKSCGEPVEAGSIFCIMEDFIGE